MTTDGVEIIETTDEDGKVHIFERVEEVEVEGVTYALLVYRGGDEEPLPEGADEEVVVMRVSKDPDGTDVFEQIEDETEFDKVLAYIDTLESSDFEIVTDDDEEGDHKDCTDPTHNHG